jgi:prepilin-type N-terminal cleavage/methylation domain-containing protein
MRNSNSIRSAPGRARGLSLPEVMISLSITATLLVAVAAAFCASATAIENNDGFFRCSQAGRVTLNQLLAEIRNCDSLDMSTANTIKIIRQALVQGNQEYSRQANELSRSFVYDSVNKRITLQISYSDGTFSPLYELTSKVSACAFGPPEMGLDYNNAEIPVRVPIMVTVSTGGNTVVLDGAAAPRRAMKY